jgi:hypothetical protein
MQDGRDDPTGDDLPAPSYEPGNTELPVPPGGARPVRSAGDAPAVVAAPPTPAEPSPPQLPRNDAKRPPAVLIDPAPPTRGAETWYRSDQDRFQSVHNRANPWYRRLARGVIGLALLAAAGIGLFFAARVVQDYLERDRLPAQGTDVPEIRATSFEIRSTSPAPVIDGTLTMDAATMAFEYTGRGTGPQAGIQVVSPDGTTTYVRRDAGAWQVAGAGDPVVDDVTLAVSVLADDDNADDILTTQLRRGYVDLVERTELGEGDDRLRRYEVRLDTRSFDDEFPLQFRDFNETAIPGVESVRGLIVTITLDTEDVLVAVDGQGTNWSWQRLTYSDRPFLPADPSGATIVITDGSVDDG